MELENFSFIFVPDIKEVIFQTYLDCDVIFDFTNLDVHLRVILAAHINYGIPFLVFYLLLLALDLYARVDIVHAAAPKLVIFVISFHVVYLHLRATVVKSVVVKD